MKKKLLKTLVDTIKPGPKDIKVWDTEILGFVLRVRPNGRKFFYLDYFFAQKRRRIALGEYGTVSPEEARRKALDNLKLIADGTDPLTVKAEAKAAPTVDEFVAEYLERHARAHKKPRSVQDDERYIEDFIKPHLGHLKVAKVTRPAVAQLHHDLRETPTTANRVLACLSKMMNLAELWGYREDGTNPCRHIKRYRESKRERFLSAEELGRLAAALVEAEQTGNASWVAVQAVRLLLLTGMRVGEVLPLEWAWVDLDGQKIDLPDSKTGAKTVLLNTAAVAVLADLQAYQARRKAKGEEKGKPWLGGRWVFPGRKSGEPLLWLEPAWRRIRTAAKIEDVRIHDLRHTHGSIGAGEGLGLPIIGALLGHSQPSTTLRYSHVAKSPALAASELIGARIIEAMTPGAQIVDVTPAAASEPAKAETAK